MKKIIAGLIFLLFLNGCTNTQGPDFTKRVVIIRKTSSSKDLAIYETIHDQGVEGSGWGSVQFAASPSFAEVGDEIIEYEGKITVNHNKDSLNKEMNNVR